MASISVEHGGSPNGKLAATQSGFEMPRPKSSRPRGVTAAAWAEREEQRTMKAKIREMAVRLAAADLMLFTPAARPAVPWDLQCGVTPMDLGDVQQPTDQPHEHLELWYDAAQNRLQQAGLFRLTPLAGVVASASRWDLERLLDLEAYRMACGISAPLLIVVDPNEMARRNGMCIGSSGARWSTPYPLLKDRAILAGTALPPEPPIWWNEADSSTVPPEPENFVACAHALTAWRTAVMPSKHSRSKGSALADSSAAARILPYGQQRVRAPSLKAGESHSVHSS